MDQLVNPVMGLATKCAVQCNILTKASIQMNKPVV